MSRRRAAEKRECFADSKYGDKVIAKFINSVMNDGKKAVAEKIVYDALDIAVAKDKRGHVEIFHEVLNSIKPSIEVRSRRVGGATYQVPGAVRPNRQQALAIRWIIKAVKTRSERNMKDKLGAELLDVLNNRGASIKKREDTHKMAEANKAFSHFRW